MENVSESAPPPAELKLAWNCERWHTLPDSGGYLEQDYFTMHRMNAYSNIYNTLRRAQALTGKNIHRLTEKERLTLRYLMDLGILFRA